VTTRPRTTLKDIAVAAGVSMTTVSHALNSKGRIDPATRARIVAVASELGYTPDPRARALRTGVAQAIVYVSSVSASDTGATEQASYLMHSAYLASQEALETGRALVLVPPQAQARWVETLVVDGAVVAHPVANDPLLEILRRRGLPVVTIGRDVDSTDADEKWVGTDARALVDIAFGHLHDRGSRRPALMTAPERRSIAVAAHSQYVRWTAERNIEPIFVEASQHDAVASARDAFHKLLLDDPTVDGVFVPLDANGAGCVEAIKDAGLRVGHDVRVITTDGTWAQRSTPPITVLDLHVDQQAIEAVRMLVRMLEGDIGPEHRLIRPTLIVRGTT
jgi:DNA-binding LacI/PurR family transcriptional regulator